MTRLFCFYNFILNGKTTIKKKRKNETNPTQIGYNAPQLQAHILGSNLENYLSYSHMGVSAVVTTLNWVESKT